MAQLPTPLMFYDSEVFKTENRLDVLARNKTFLLDQDNKIVLVGEPFNNQKLLNLYVKEIQILKGQYKN